MDEVPALTIFMWQNGAPFDDVLARYTSASLPTGIDPNFPSVVQTLGALNGSLNVLAHAGNITLPMSHLLKSRV